MNPLQAFTNEQLLAELIRRHKVDTELHKIRSRTYGPMMCEIVVGIGRDSFASVTFAEEDMVVLEQA